MSKNMAALPEEVLTLAEIAENTGASLMTVRTWTHRYPGFPEPWKEGRLGMPNLYLLADVERWLQRTGRAALPESSAT